jgi:mRNA-degrading endonuclease RelE of RelBE toxin-antitoxin system
MNVEIIITDIFKREAKKLIKKYRSLKSELVSFEESLTNNPQQGTLIAENVYKIRVSVKSKGKGKSGGLRIITYLRLLKKEDGNITAYLLTIYDKSDLENLPEYQIEKMVSNIQAEFCVDEVDQEKQPEASENEDDYIEK